MARRFPDPFSVAAPPGADGWEAMYPEYLCFTEDTREVDREGFWFQDGLHYPRALHPFDVITVEATRIALGQYNSRVFQVPPAYGLEWRILNGYAYIRPVPVLDPGRVAERAEVFRRRAGHYYDRWDELFDRWKVKVRALIDELEGIRLPALEREEDERVVLEARGISSGYELVRAYDRAVDNLFVAWQHHFEMLNLGYAAYLNLFEFCRRAFPGITDDAVAALVSGTDLLFHQPDQRLKELAALAVELGLQGAIRQARPPDQIIEGLGAAAGGRRWVEALRRAERPWFYCSTEGGFYHESGCWLDDLRIPWAALVHHLDRLESGQGLDLDRNGTLARRERLAAEYAELLGGDADREAFDVSLGLARRVAAYIEDHNFYVEHWHHTLFWRKVRDFGRALAEGGLLEGPDDVFLLHRWEVAQAVYELASAWATGVPSRGHRRWRRVAAGRRGILAALRASTPPPVLGDASAEVTEPLTTMLFGITGDRLDGWLRESEPDGALSGIAASPGRRSGTVEVVRDTAELQRLGDGEVLVCPSLHTSWLPLVNRAAAVVSEAGGVMSHAAILCREFGLPAVVGASLATRSLRTGDVVEVDGDRGTVTVLSRAAR